MTSGPLPTAPTVNSILVWDGENRLTRSTVGSVTTSYKYDAQSRRIAKIAGTATTSAAAIYLYDAWNCIADYSRSAGVSPTFTLKKTRLWGTDLSNTPQSAGGVAGLLSESFISNPQSPIYYPTYDGNGNISEYLTSTGTIVAHFEYDTFGNTVVNTDTGNLFTYRFSTKPRDIETGIYYYGYRYYDPMTGRWPSRDPIGERGGINLYGFGQNNPICSYDYLGKNFFGDLWDAISGGNELAGKEGLPPLSDGENMKVIASGVTCIKLQSMCMECNGAIMAGKKCDGECDDICQRAADCAAAGSK